MELTNKKMAGFINIVNQSTREYLIILIDNQAPTPKGIDTMDIDMAFDDLDLHTKTYDLNPDQRKSILQINYFTQKAVLKWLKVKRGMDMGNTLDKKDINFVFDQMAESVLKCSDLLDENPVTMATHNTKV